MYNEVLTVAWFKGKERARLNNAKLLRPTKPKTARPISDLQLLLRQRKLYDSLPDLPFHPHQIQLIKSIWQEARENSGKGCRLCSRTALGQEAAAVVVSDSEEVVRLLEVQLLRLLSW